MSSILLGAFLRKPKCCQFIFVLQFSIDYGNGPTRMVLNFRTDRSWQTVQTQIRLFLEEQSDQGLHCFCYIICMFLTKYQVTLAQKVNNSILHTFQEKQKMFFVFFAFHSCYCDKLFSNEFSDSF